MNRTIMGATVGTPHRPSALSEKIGPFLVTVAQNEDGDYTADKTYGELVEAKRAGRTLSCRYYDDDVYLPFTAYHGLFTFSAVIDSKLYQIDITAAGQSQEAQAKVTTTPIGISGKDGITPHIGANGNWWIGEEDTGVSAGVTDERIVGVVEEYMEENPLVKTVNGTAPDENGNVELELPSGGGSSPDGGAFRITMILEEDVSSVVLKIPVKWEKIVQFNFNCVPKLSGDAKVEMRNGGNYRVIGDLSSGTKSFNIYGIQYWRDMFSRPFFTCGLAVAGNAEDTARPTIPAASMAVDPNVDEIHIYTVGGTAVFQAGTKFEMWGVYTP